MLDTITFDQLPQAVAKILDELAEIKSICEGLREDASDKDAYMTIEEFCAYHPDHPSQQTVRRWKRFGSFHSTKTTKPVELSSRNLKLTIG